MAVRSVLLYFALAALFTSGVIGENESEKDVINAVEDNTEFSVLDTSAASSLSIANFADSSEITNWEDRSDTLDDGASKWAGVWHNTSTATGAIFFYALLPSNVNSVYANGRKKSDWNLSSYKSIKIRFLAQGSPLKYKVVCRTYGADGPTDPLYDLRFKALNTTKWQRVTLPLDRFVPSVRGVINDNLVFDTANITSLAISSYGAIGTNSLYIKDISAA